MLVSVICCLDCEICIFIFSNVLWIFFRRFVFLSCFFLIVSGKFFLNLYCKVNYRDYNRSLKFIYLVVCIRVLKRVVYV